MLWRIFLRSVRRLLVTANAVPSSPTLVTLMMEERSSSETVFLQEPHRVTSPKMPFFIVTAAKTSTLTWHIIARPLFPLLGPTEIQNLSSPLSVAVRFQRDQKKGHNTAEQHDTTRLDKTHMREVTVVVLLTQIYWRCQNCLTVEDQDICCSKTAVTMQNAVFWDFTPRGSCMNRRSGGTYHHNHQGEKNQRRNNVSSNC
jgi:hypothetical protein